MTGSRKTNVPAIPAIKRGDSASLERAMEAIKEATEVGFGRRGEPLDRFVTLRELQDGGIAQISGNGRGGAVIVAPGGNSGPGDGAPIFDPDPPDYGENDFTVPPAPTGVTGRGVPVNKIMVTWNPPNYGNHLKAEIFCLLEKPNGDAPTLGEVQADLAAAKVGEADGTIFMHTDLANVTRPGQSPLDMALNPAKRYYWVRFVSFAQVRGPFAPLNGAMIQMALDPVAVLDAMIGNITASSIYSNLRGWMGSLPNDPILAAGGIRRYVNQQDALIIGEFNELEAIIGTNVPGDPNLTLFQWLRQVNAVANANSAQLSDITTWQAALSMAANGGEEAQAYTVTSYTGTSHENFAIDMWVAPGSPPFVVGDSFVVSAPSTGLFGPANGRTVVAANVFTMSQTIQRIIVVRSPELAVFPITFLYDFTGPNNLNTRLVRVNPDAVDFVDFIATVQRNIFVAVDPDTALAHELNLVRAQIGEVGAETQVLNQAFASIDGRLENLWSVRMQQQANGLTFSAGFGLGLETDSSTGESISTFLVNANQFAIMGPQGPGVLVTGYERISGTRARLVVASEAHGLVAWNGGPPPMVGNPPHEAAYRITLVIPDDPNVRIPVDPEEGDPDPPPVEIGNPLLSLRNKEFFVRLVGGGVGFDGSSAPYIEIEEVTGANVFPNISTAPTSVGRYILWQTQYWDPVKVARLNYSALPPNNIPFIVDTLRNVVGIRGSLIVDGLISATAGTFGTLTAATAFIQQLQAEVVNANVVIGQRLIAGTPGSGALTAGAYDAISNYIVEMNNPVTNQFPLRLWKPSTQSMAFGLDRLGNLFVGGNMSVGGNAVIATNDILPGAGQSANAVLFSVGGVGADADQSKYAIWVGPKNVYGTNGGGRRESNALFFIKENGRAGFNADLFLGSGALALPSVAAQTEASQNPGAVYDMPTSSTIRATSLVQSAISVNGIRIRANRDGGVAPTIVTVSGLLVAAGTPGGGNDKFFKIRAELTDTGGTPVAGGLIQEFIQDDYSPECMPFSMSNVMNVPASPNYRVKITVETIASTKPMSIIRGWNVVAMQVGA